MKGSPLSMRSILVMSFGQFSHAEAAGALAATSWQKGTFVLVFSGLL